MGKNIKLRCGNWLFLLLSALEFKSFYNNLPRCVADGDEIYSPGQGRYINLLGFGIEDA